MKTEEKIILSADELNKEQLIELVQKVGQRVYAVKIHDLYDKFGPEIVNILKQVGAKRVWVDFKLHDIPNTVKLRAKALAEVGADILTVHASGGKEMLVAAKQGFGSKKVYAVSALTSLSNQEIEEIYGEGSVESLVLKLAKLAKESGIDGLVCSPKEVAVVRADPNCKTLELVVPGIRSAGVSADDQKRFDTPVNALTAGADFLVVGRQITKAENPENALNLIQAEIAYV